MVDIVIVNWNGGSYLQKCVDSILIFENDIFLNKVIVVDNASSDTSCKSLHAHPKITLIKNKQNIGFAKACNQGFKLCISEYVLLLNPDAMLKNTTISKCIDFMNTSKDIDILGCELQNEAGEKTKSCARFPTPVTIFFDACGLSKIAPNLFKPATLMIDWDHNENRRVDQVMGAFMFIRRKIFEKIGYFDERFFVYYEELDFSRRLFKVGGISFYNKDISAVHVGGGTTSSVKAFRLFLNLQSRLKYAKKHFNLSGYALAWISTSFIELFTRILLTFIQLDLNGFKNTVQAYYMLIVKKKAYNS